MKEKLEKVRSRSQRRKRRAQELRKLQSIREMTGGRPHVPIRTQAVTWADDGLTTPVAGGEDVGIDFTLPAEALEWSLPDARYRIYVRTSGDASSVRLVNNQGRTLRERQVYEQGIFDINEGTLRLESSQPVTSIDLYRYEARMTGEVVLGPFQERGIVRAETRGDGSWGAAVASEPQVQGSVEVTPQPKFERSGDPWRGRPPSEEQPAPPDGETIPWAHARRFPNVDLDLEFYEAVRVGDVFLDHEERTLDSTKTIESGRWWRRLREWTVLGAHQAPSFDSQPAVWTNVWGRAEGADAGWDLRTGRPSDPTSRGIHLIRTDDPEAVTIEGDWGADATPLGPGDTLAAGTYGHATVDKAPNRVYVRLRGQGQLSDVRLQTTRRFGPGALETEDIRTIDLSKYFGDETRRDTSGRGSFLAAE